ncbi:MAG: translation elongation factor Ts [Acidobacteriota bacterium]|nr:translation elongation factor Ts [Acidobacteriota bacterium]MDE3223351.1 translation elongation factor Ts [Acidobacteriota bacterium]
MAITAKDVQALRQSTGVGMMDAKKALEATNGDMEAATQWLRVQGLASAAKRAEREAGEGAVSVVRDGNVAAIVEMKCETDFVAKSEEFVTLVDEIAARVAADGEGAVAQFQDQIETMLTTLKENISVGRVHRLAAGDGEVVETYIHQQSGRGVNAVAVVLKGGDVEMAHEICVHIAFAKPQFLKRDDVPSDQVEAERKTVEEISRNEGKPEAALPKIIEGRLNGWFKERVLLEQSYVKDEKQSIEAFLNGATIVAYAQVVVGG